MHNYILAIDPDVDKSGVCLLFPLKKRVECFSFPFPVLVEYLKDVRLLFPNTIVLVEAGWLNKSNWHLKAADSKRIASAKGNATGRNHETGRIIVQMCKHIGFDTVEVKPLKKIWKGPDKKITHSELAKIVPGLPTRTNQEIRDAVLIAWTYK